MDHINVTNNGRSPKAAFLSGGQIPFFLFIHFLFSSYIFCWLCWQKGQSVIEPFPPRSCMTVVLAYWGNKDSCFSLGNRKPFSSQHDFFHDPYLTKIFNVIKKMLKSTVKIFSSNQNNELDFLWMQQLNYCFENLILLKSCTFIKILSSWSIWDTIAIFKKVKVLNKSGRWIILKLPCHFLPLALAAPSSGRK